MKPQPLITVRDVQVSSCWYQDVLGITGVHLGSDYEQLLHQGVMVLQLHSWEAHGHRYLGVPTSQPYGKGVVLWFFTEDVRSAYERALCGGANILEALAINQNANHREFWLKDPDAYIVVVAGRTGDLCD